MMLYNKKKRLIKNVENLTEIELQEIFLLLKNKNIEYTSNKNGIFINLKNFNETLINELEEYIIFSKNNNKFLENKIKINNEFIKNYNKSNIDLIHNFEEYGNLKNIDFLNKVNLNYKRKKKTENQFLNIIKKYNRILLNVNENDLNLNELKHEKYKIK
jgi:hypothetical protein|tara:strand:- start:250 stop:726 length:477 start_codon:yes stop_codon:yes gene_type:complete